MRCSACRYENDQGSVFCASCGSKLEMQKSCPHCGVSIEDNGAFCHACGGNLKETVQVVKEGCSHCGAINEPGTKFCFRCGTALAVQVTSGPQPTQNNCQLCGAENEAGSPFCYKCGQKMMIGVREEKAVQAKEEKVKLQIIESLAVKEKDVLHEAPAASFTDYIPQAAQALNLSYKRICPQCKEKVDIELSACPSCEQIF